MIERANDEKTGAYAFMSLKILEHAPKDTFHDSEEFNRLLSRSYQYKAVGCIFTDSPGALQHVKCMIGLIADRMKR